jgi:hypothetical protein
MQTFHTPDGFIFSIPIFAVLKDDTTNPDGTMNFAGVGNCTIRGHLSVCLFTDVDLAERHIKQFPNESGLGVGEFHNADHLIDFLEKVDALGFQHTVFDPNAQAGGARAPQFAETRDIIAGLRP